MNDKVAQQKNAVSADRNGTSTLQLVRGDNSNSSSKSIPVLQSTANAKSYKTAFENMVANFDTQLKSHKSDLSQRSALMEKIFVVISKTSFAESEEKVTALKKLYEEHLICRPY